MATPQVDTSPPVLQTVMPETASNPEQLQVPVSPIDSGSDYSQADSRPVSMIKEEKVASSTTSDEQEQDEDVFQSPEASRPVSMQEGGGIESRDKEKGDQGETAETADAKEETTTAAPSTQSATLRPPSDHLAPPTSPTLSTYSGSDYSQNDSRPTSLEQSSLPPAELPAEEPTRKSRPASIMVNTSEMVDEPLHTPNAETRSQPSISPESKRSSREEEKELPSGGTPSAKTRSRPASLKSKHDSQATSNFDVTHSPSPYDETNPWDANKAQLPVITASPYADAAEGSDYSGSAPQSPKTPKVPVSPMTPDEAHMSINSMESVALSESSMDYDHLSSEQVNDALATPRARGHVRKPSSLEILQNNWMDERPMMQRQSTFFDITKDQPLETPVDGPGNDAFGEVLSRSAAPSVNVVDTNSRRTSFATPTRRSSSSEEGDGEVEVDWYALDRTEEQEKEDRDLAEGEEDETTAFLLARLEQENAKFSADPKSSIVGNKTVGRIRSKSRPPSMAMLKKLVRQDTAPSIRYSLASEPDCRFPDDPPPMTELEFWGALVQDYPTTASRLPTLTTTKIRNGVPDPLRQHVWPSMAGARDKALEEAYEKLVGEKSPYEGIINKDVGRSFPGVELFRDAEGEGQKMLGRVLKCYSLFDKDIGYCQGLGFLVGPLLMNMGEREAFCVLVRLMDHYALRPSFLPSLSGLHMRIFQFSTLLNQHHPKLSEHLTSLGVEPAYLSQWFLSCFAVTCPLPMLFRIYDVIFAEGANETVMRVALALFRRNEERMLHSQEFEEVMQLLLGRHLWDVYGHNADELVDDFTSLGHIITHQRLQELEQEFETKDSDAVGQSAGFLPDVQAAASRFLGRLWAPSHNHTPSKSAASTLSPSSAEKDGANVNGATASPAPSSGVFGRGSFLRRSPSKQSISTLNESSNGSEGSISTLASTAPTDGEGHDSSIRESQSTKPGSLRTISVQAGSIHESRTPAVREQQELHTQIEDLLMALSDMQREHAQMVAMLQREREERGDDQRIVRQLVQRLKPQAKKDDAATKKERRSMPPPKRATLASAVEIAEDGKTKAEDKRRTLPARPKALPDGGVPLKAEEAKAEEKAATPEDQQMSLLIDQIQSRLDANTRISASFETKAQLRDALARTREQLAAAEQQAKERLDRVEFAESSMNTYQAESENLRAEAEELRVRVNEEFREKTKLELQVQNLEIQMRMEAKSLENKEKRERVAKLQRAESSGEVPTINTLNDGGPSRRQSIASAPGGGLRELRLGSGRRDSAGSVQSIRGMRGQRPVSPTVAESPVKTESSSPETTVPTTPTAASAPVPAPVPAAAPAPAPASAAEPATLATPQPKQAGHARQPSSSLNVPTPFTPGHLPRKSSLATREVLATPKHEPVPDEALLLELVNAKTAEAQALQELDELKRSMQLQRRRMEEEAKKVEEGRIRAEAERRRVEERVFELQAEALNARAEAEGARVREAAAQELARMARAGREAGFDASPIQTPGVEVSAPEERGRWGMGDSQGSSRSSTPGELGGKKAHGESGSSAGGGGGWFWSRRTASTTKAGM